MRNGFLSSLVLFAVCVAAGVASARESVAYVAAHGGHVMPGKSVFDVLPKVLH